MLFWVGMFSTSTFGGALHLMIQSPLIQEFKLSTPFMLRFPVLNQFQSHGAREPYKAKNVT